MKKIKVAVDVGNSNVVIGLYFDGVWEKIYRLSTKRNFTYWSFQKKLKKIIDLNDFNPSNIESVIISSVVPTLTDIVKLSCNDMLCENIYIVRASSVKRVNISIDNINEIGTDLLSNAVEGSSMYDDNVVVVDFGTALTFTVISKNKDVLGVNIVPGLKTAINSLYKNTANLPVIDLKIPDKVIGKNTVHSIQSGIMHGYVGLVKEILSKIKNELVGDTKVIATGGLSKFAEPLKVEFDDIIPTLTLDGMIKILEDYENS
ncbi:MAG: type III pantothenate kinase [Flammeovirgaceae bacterium]|nr:type III pantothenate kinase [Flammeovirgaceae bacterium]|tara:strand:+ start:2046 stop:2825 length:780 start_codon:yes stop_codon:yes gene_type:complete